MPTSRWPSPSACTISVPLASNDTIVSFMSEK
jgi:hypothetical protein